MVAATKRIDSNKTYTSNAGNFDPHVDAMVQCGAHCPMTHIPGFIRCHQMTPLGKCLRHIVPAAAMVNNLFENTKHYFAYGSVINYKNN